MRALSVQHQVKHDDPLSISNSQRPLESTTEEVQEGQVSGLEVDPLSCLYIHKWKKGCELLPSTSTTA